MKDVQQTSTAKIPVFFQNCLKRVWWLKINENKITTENAFDCDYLGNGGNISLDNDPKNFQVFLKILDVLTIFENS